MAYFPNGTAGMMYQEQFCVRCTNYRDKGDGRGHGCGIWDVHLLFGYPNTDAAKAQAEVLDVLIPRDGIGAAECTMFVDDRKDHDTLPLPGVG